MYRPKDQTTHKHTKQNFPFFGKSRGQGDTARQFFFNYKQCLVKHLPYIKVLNLSVEFTEDNSNVFQMLILYLNKDLGKGEYVAYNQFLIFFFAFYGTTLTEWGNTVFVPFLFCCFSVCLQKKTNNCLNF